MTDKRELRNKAGVVLWEITMRSGGAPVAAGYSVTSGRMPIARTFDNLSAAEQCYDEEVAFSLGK